MMNKIKQPFVQLIAALGLIFSLSNCEQVVDLPVYEYEPSIVIFGVLEADSIPKIFVTESEAFYTYTNTDVEYELIKNATVEISNGNQTWKLQPDSVQYLPPGRIFLAGFGNDDINKKPYYANAFTSNMTLEAGENYEVTVQKNGVTAKARTTVLLPMQVEFGEQESNEDFNSPRLNFEILNKPFGQYYRTLVAYPTTRYQCDYNFETDDFELVDSFKLHQYDERGNYKFDDDQSGFQPDYINFTRNVCSPYKCPSRSNEPDLTSFPEDSVQVQVSVQLIDSNLMNYITQINYQQEVEYNPFLEPAPVDHPVENGLGILTSVATSKWETFWVKCKQ